VIANMRVACLFGLLGLLCVAWAADQNKVFQGVHPDDKHRYIMEGRAKFSCQEKDVEWDRVNDDYCDCLDGSDEPGTSACPNAQFYCVNKGFMSKHIRSNFVQDGVCDCCDGSDEVEGQCKNTCHEQGAEIREKLVKEIEMHTQGHAIKQQLQVTASTLIAQKREQLETARTNQQAASAKLDDVKARKDPVEARVKEVQAARDAEAEVRKKDYEERLTKAKEAKKAELLAAGTPEDKVDEAVTEANVTVEQAEEPSYEASEDDLALTTLNNEFTEAENEKKPLDSEVSNLEHFVALDFGPGAAFASLHEQCFKQRVRQ